MDSRTKQTIAGLCLLVLAAGLWLGPGDGPMLFVPAAVAAIAGVVLLARGVTRH